MPVVVSPPPPPPGRRAALAAVGVGCLVLFAIAVGVCRAGLPGPVVGAAVAPLTRVGGAGGGAPPAGAAFLNLPPAIRRLHINVGPNTSPLVPPPGDPSTGVLAVEAQLAIAARLRDSHARRYPDRFFVIPAALAGEGGVGFGSLSVYNKDGQSSSLAVTADTAKFAAARSGGTSGAIGRGVEFVPVLTLPRLLAAVPPRVAIPLLKTDTQGFDFAVVAAADRATLRRVHTVVAEVYRRAGDYVLPAGVSNDLHADWVPHMRAMGYRLLNVTGLGGEGDATFERIGEP